MTVLDRATPSGASATDLDLGTWGKDKQSRSEQIILGLFIGIPFLALLASIPLAWGGFLTWRDAVVAVVLYLFAGHGITVGFHRYFTHGAFKAKRSLKILLAVAGSMAIEGPIIRWVADHRKHHKFSDKDGDPHSPWRYGDSVPALMKGLFYAHMGWLFDEEQTPQKTYAPDLMKDPDIRRISKAFPYLTAVSLILPFVIGGFWNAAPGAWNWGPALQMFFWASLVRVALLHHVTWSINSICHAIGERPFKSRDRSGNVWWLALLSMGEAWHNFHHADPTSARHGVLRFQFDTSARMIWVAEKLGLAYDVRWPQPDRIESRRVAA